MSIEANHGFRLGTHSVKAQAAYRVDPSCPGDHAGGCRYRCGWPDPRDTTGVTPSAGTEVGGGSESKEEEKSGNWFTRFLNFGKEGENSHLPEVILGPPGGEAELESCNGEFIEMIKYRQPGMPPLYSAHNTCDGDIILGWSIGQKVRVAGSDVVYEVIEERQAMPYEDSRVLEGMSGKFILQTCFYGEERMRFLSLRPVS